MPGAPISTVTTLAPAPEHQVKQKIYTKKQQPMFAMREASTCAAGQVGRQRTASFRDSSLRRASPLDRDRAAAQGDGLVSASPAKAAAPSSAASTSRRTICAISQGRRVPHAVNRSRRREHALPTRSPRLPRATS